MKIPQGFQELSKEAAKQISGFRKALIISHDDADGLSSASIAIEGLRRVGIESEFFCLEKVFPEVLARVHSRKGELIIYCDIGSSHSDLIGELDCSRNTVIILDHHEPAGGNYDNVFDLNLERWGIRGEAEFSGATCCYLFFKLMREENWDLSYLAVVGSLEIPDGFRGINGDVLKEALDRGVVIRKKSKLYVKKLGIGCEELFSILQVLGAAGYYSGGPRLGIRACLNGIDEEVGKFLKEVEELRKKANRRMLAILSKQGLRKEGRVQWFSTGKIYEGMGTKVIGQFCSFLAHQRKLIDQDKYIVGFMDVPSSIPGFGNLSEKYVKVSVRVPEGLKRRIELGELKSAVHLLLEASREVGGIADGHQFAASAILPKRKEDEFRKRLIELA
ncbi:MAG: DHH family phosphoesterase [Candidatus Nanoarchaeia archaeon]|nr:DHH family phosphoesterase [Candidatus Haiyanarchaeum thermophilum]MCW1303332.1 DHH family phosphoesterase [Candidatus Haiyanarchaeum thermophilum]MCW1304086.1 DHH family phosphoesterase [Candidatus Haiyanarchaeum thermophilum]MCW1307212.1 DHH family phosphoesterase [Candidatus Haiyanarchaeum thermophilum]MCW1308892.1 DHH family phosphoesterase [Candidatus Haiyanarchaeum thermophilum]